MTESLEDAIRQIRTSRDTIALTGAGISVESGIPPFRGAGSIWEKIDPMEYAHIRSFRKNPKKVWDVLLRAMKQSLDSARPNPGHNGLAALERQGLLSTVITQNVDGLHQMAGSGDVIEFHGSFARCRCEVCDTSMPMKRVSLDLLPPACSCGGLLRPDCVFFGETIPEEALFRAMELAATCEVMLVVGTSAVVSPASELPLLAKENGATIIEINPEKTPLTDSVSTHFIKGKAGKILTDITSRL